MGSLSSHRQMIAHIARASASPVFSVAYRLAPENPFPAAVEDASAAYRWLVKKGFSPRRMAIAGDSAGGGLTLATLLTLRDAGDPLPSSGICISPWTDLTCSSDTYRTKSAADPIVNLEGSQEFAAMYLNGRDPKTPLASPLFADLAGLPPLLVQVGTEEALLNDSVALDRNARTAGVDCSLEIWEEMIHVWHLFAPILQKGREAVLRIGEYFHRHVS